MYFFLNGGVIRRGLCPGNKKKTHLKTDYCTLESSIGGATCSVMEYKSPRGQFVIYINELV